MFSLRFDLQKCYFITIFECEQFYSRELLLDKDNNTYKKGDNITNEKYAKTLKIIQQDPESFYNGSLAKNISRDMRNINSTVSQSDLGNYTKEIQKALKGDLSNMTMYLSPPRQVAPCPVPCALILDILTG